MSPLHIAIVDDHPLFRRGLKHILLGLENVEQVIITEHFEQLENYCKTENINLILMDIDLGQDSGITLTAKIKNLYPAIKVLALSAMEASNYVQKMIDAGASGYIHKSLEIEELSKAIQAVASGKLYFSTKLIQGLFKTPPQKNVLQKAKSKLTIRELEILDFVIHEELSNKEIADRLFISPRTVETHKRNILQKLKVKNMIGLTKYYFENKESLIQNYGIPLEQNTYFTYKIS